MIVLNELFKKRLKTTGKFFLNSFKIIFWVEDKITQVMYSRLKKRNPKIENLELPL